MKYLEKGVELCMEALLNLPQEEMVETLIAMMELKDNQLNDRFRSNPDKYMEVVVYQIGAEYYMRERSSDI